MSAEVIRWPRHLLIKIDGLFMGGVACRQTMCRTCGAADEELATECPGYRLHADEFAAVRNGRVDWVSGRWVPLYRSEPIEK